MERLKHYKAKTITLTILLVLAGLAFWWGYQGFYPQSSLVSNICLILLVCLSFALAIAAGEMSAHFLFFCWLPPFLIGLWSSSESFLTMTLASQMVFVTLNTIFAIWIVGLSRWIGHEVAEA